MPIHWKEFSLISFIVINIRRYFFSYLVSVSIFAFCAQTTKRRIHYWHKKPYSSTFGFLIAFLIFNHNEAHDAQTANRRINCCAQ